MEIVIETGKQKLTIRLIGQLWEQDDLKALTGTIDESFRTTMPVIILDLSRLTFISSQGLGTIVKEFVKANQAGKKLFLYGPGANVSEMLEIAGFELFMKILRSEEDLDKAIMKE